MWGDAEVICSLAECHADLIRKFYQKTNNKDKEHPWNYVSGKSFINLSFLYTNKYISEESTPSRREHWLPNKNGRDDKTVN